MKKFTALLLALVMVLSLAACGAKNDATTDIADATTLLSNVFAQYAEDEKFPDLPADVISTIRLLRSTFCGRWGLC